MQRAGSDRSPTLAPAVGDSGSTQIWVQNGQASAPCIPFLEDEEARSSAAVRCSRPRPGESEFLSGKGKKGFHLWQVEPWIPTFFLHTALQKGEHRGSTCFTTGSEMKTPHGILDKVRRLEDFGACGEHDYNIV